MSLNESAPGSTRGPAAPPKAPIQRPLHRRLGRWLRRNPLGALGLGVVLVIGMAGILAPFVTPFEPESQNIANTFGGASAEHLLGTDDLGRDVLTRVMYSARVSMLAALFAVAVGLGLGIPVGLIAGYVGGFVDSVLMRVVDGLLSIPALLLAIAVTGALGPNLRNAMLAVGVIFSPVFARLIRAQVLAVKSVAYLEAARLFGGRSWWIIGRHVVPNTFQPIVVQSAILLGVALIAEASLSFLGLGVQPPQASWGTMLSRAQRYMTIHPFMMLPPGVAIALTVLGFNLFGDALRDTLDPDD